MDFSMFRICVSALLRALFMLAFVIPCLSILVCARLYIASRSALHSSAAFKERTVRLVYEISIKQ